MFTTTHNSRRAEVYATEYSVYATYANGDVFYHVEVDDESVDLEADLVREFGEVLAAEIIAEVRR